MDGPDSLREVEEWRERVVRLEQAVDSERKRRREAEAQLEGLRAIAVAGSIDAMETTLAAALRPLFHYTHGFVLAGDAGSGLRARGATLPAFEGLRFEPGALLRRVLAGNPVAVFDARAVEEWAAQPAEVQGLVGAALFVPFVTAQRCTVLVGTRPERAAFSPAEVTLARRFVETAVPVIESLDRKDAERARLAAEARAAGLEERQRELEQQIATIASQRAAIERLTAPVIRLWRGILVVPFTGTMDADTASLVTERLLHAMVQHRAACALMDVTGVADVSEQTASFLERIVRCVELLGGVCLITGMQPAVAQKLVDLRVDLSAFQAFVTLEEGLRAALGRLGLGVWAARNPRRSHSEP